MKQIFRSYLFVFIGVLGFLASCSKSEISTLIPKDATVVAAIDVDTLLYSSGDGEFASFCTSMMETLSTEEENLEEQIAFIQKYFETPEKMGLNFHKPVYLFHSPSMKHDYIVVGEVFDEDALGEFFEEANKLEKKPAKFGEYEGLKYVESKKDLFVYTDKWFFKLENQKHLGSVEKNLQEVVELLDMDEKESIKSEKDFKKMTKTNGIAQVVVRGAFVEEMCEKMHTPVDSLQQYLPKNTTFSDFACLMNYDSKEKNMKLSLRALGLNDKAEDALDHLPVGEISGDLNQFVNSEAIAVLATSMKGSVIFDRFLMKIPEFKAWVLTYSQEVNLFRQWLMSINGDMIFTLDGVDETAQMSTLLQMHNTSWIENPLIEGFPGLTKLDNGDFVFPTPMGILSFGCATVGKKDLMYAFFDHGKKELSAVAKPLDLGSNVNFYANINFDPMLESAIGQNIMKSPTVGKQQFQLLLMYDHMEIIVTDKREITLNFAVKKGFKDILINTMLSNMKKSTGL